MSSPEVVAAAESFLGAPFQNHYVPVDHCYGGSVTLNHCMDRGLDTRGFDCSGLVIASICLPEGIAPQDWPKPSRHVAQLSDIARGAVKPDLGDAVYLSKKLRGGGRRMHAGIYIGDDQIIHADGRKGKVVVGPTGHFDHIRTIPRQAIERILESATTN